VAPRTLTLGTGREAYGQLHASTALTPRKKPQMTTEHNIRWAPETVWPLTKRKKKVLKLARIEPRPSVIRPFTVPTELSRFPINDEYTVFARVISAPAYFAHPYFLKDDFGFIFAPRISRTIILLCLIGVVQLAPQHAVASRTRRSINCQLNIYCSH
jgi:hypothetical protein